MTYYDTSKRFMEVSMRDYSFSTYAKFSVKLIFLILILWYQGVPKNSFSEHFAYVVNEWPPKLHYIFLNIAKCSEKKIDLYYKHVKNPVKHLKNRPVLQSC